MNGLNLSLFLKVFYLIKSFFTKKQQETFGLENFQIDEEETPNLFNSDDSENNENSFAPVETNENNKEEDDLEIPAFLRRQKN